MTATKRNTRKHNAKKKQKGTPENEQNKHKPKKEKETQKQKRERGNEQSTWNETRNKTIGKKNIT